MSRHNNIPRKTILGAERVAEILRDMKIEKLTLKAAALKHRVSPSYLAVRIQQYHAGELR